MGKLRKISRKIKRSLNKIFGKKLGNIIGGIGLSMLFFGGAEALFGNQAWFKNMTATLDKMNPFTDSTVAGSVDKVTNEMVQDGVVKDAVVKDAVVQDAVAKDLVTQNMSPIETTSTSFLEGTTSNVANMSPVSNSVSNPFIEKLASAPAGSGELTLGETFMSGMNKIGEGIKNLPQNTGEFIADIPNKIAEAPGKAYDYLSEGEFVGDVFVGAGTGVLTSTIMGDPEEPFISGGVSMQPIQEAAQDNYVRAVAPSAMAATGMTRMPSFQELSQQTLYGTGSPSWMADFYQPLPTPKAIG